MQIKRKVRVALLVADFHAAVSEKMLLAAKEAIDALDARLAGEIHVPGVYEFPLAAKHALSSPVVDALVVLGWIEKGETLHGEVMGHVVHTALMELQLEYDKPVGFGIIGPGATEEQARKRFQRVAKHAVEAVCTSSPLKWLTNLKK